MPATTMSLSKAFAPALREIRILCSQTGEASAGTRYYNSFLFSSVRGDFDWFFLWVYRQFVLSSYPVIKRYNPDLPVLIREASGTPARAFARFGACSSRFAWVVLQTERTAHRTRGGETRGVGWTLSRGRRAASGGVANTSIDLLSPHKNDMGLGANVFCCYSIHAFIYIFPWTILQMYNMATGLVVMIAIGNGGTWASHDVMMFLRGFAHVVYPGQSVLCGCPTDMCQWEAMIASV